MKNIKAGQYLLHTETDAICILWYVSPLRVANLDTLQLATIDKQALQAEYVPVSAEIVYEID